MSKKLEFIEYVEKAIQNYSEEMSDSVKMYWDAFKIDTEEEKPLFTENGKLVLQYMREQNNTPMFKAKDIGEGLFVSSRVASGALRKLVSDGYIEKVGKDPTLYSLTESGKTIEII